MFNLFGFFPWHVVWQDGMWKMLTFLTFFADILNKLFFFYFIYFDSYNLLKVHDFKIRKFQNSDSYMTDSDSYLFSELRIFWSFPLERFIKKLDLINFRNPIEISFGNSTSGHFVNINVLRRKISPNMLFYRFYRVVSLASWLESKFSSSTVFAQKLER